LRGDFKQAVFLDNVLWHHFGSEEGVLEVLRMLVSLAESSATRLAEAILVAAEGGGTGPEGGWCCVNAFVTTRPIPAAAPFGATAWRGPRRSM
jgi:hypothetical protein